ncbi:hypothetical protein SUGI_0244630 [Cryptomeria japonica]|nr:hypothetical protein SUGI_0244630 [Cryptomeria japonica]
MQLQWANQKSVFTNIFALAEVRRGLRASQQERTHESRGICKGRQNESLQSAIGRKTWPTKKRGPTKIELAWIESNIWRDHVQYGFKLHNCRLGFLFANDRRARTTDD